MSREQPTLHFLHGAASPLQQAVQSFLLDCQARSLSPKTIAYYRQDLATLTRFLDAQGIATVDALRPDAIRRYLIALQDSHNDGGVHGHFRALRAFVRFLVAEQELPSNPLANVKAPKTPKSIIEPVSLDTVSRMLKMCTGDLAERDKAMLMTLLDSGLRASELLALDVGDLDLASGRVVVQHGKGDKARVVFLGARARRAILKMLKTRAGAAPTSPLWQTTDGRRLAYGGLREVLRRRARAAGVSEPSAHDFRRAFALLSLRGGCDVYALQRLMGHADLTVLRRYLAQTEDDLRAAHERASPVDKMLVWLLAVVVTLAR